jgi:hypothetical protein
MKRVIVFVFILGFAMSALSAQRDAGTDLGRLLAAAERSGLPEASLVPVLSGLDRLQQENLPTRRYVSRMVECLAKRAPSPFLEKLSARMVEETRAARLLVDGLKAQGLKDDGAAYHWSATEELADTLVTGPVSPADLNALVRELKTKRLPRVLAGAESLAHLRALGLRGRDAHGLLAAMPADLPDAEILKLPYVFLVGRRCGVADADVMRMLLRCARTGVRPSTLALKWARQAGLGGPGLRSGPAWGHGAGPGGVGGTGPSGSGRQSGPGGAGGREGPGGSGGPSGSGGPGGGGR